MDSCTVVLPPDLDAQLRCAVGAFWTTRSFQSQSQRERGAKDQGDRANVTGGKQMAGFEALLTSLLVLNGVPRQDVITRKGIELPGYFRAAKQWDLLVVHKGYLLAVAELKSHVGSFGNNQNNRVEEAIGSSTDLWTALRESAYRVIRRPWLGYLLLLEDSPRVRTPVAVAEPHYPVLPAYKGASYAERYAQLCRRLVLENLYTDAALLLSPRGDTTGEGLTEPVAAHAFRAFAISMLSTVRIAMGQIASL